MRTFHEDCRHSRGARSTGTASSRRRLLQAGETLSGFVEEAVRRNVEFRQAQKAFIERGLASAAAARKSGKYVSSAAMLGKLSRRLEKARKRRDLTT